MQLVFVGECLRFAHMKYFTFDWWERSEPTDVFKEYGAYIKKVLHELPADLRRLEQECSLHDGRIIRLHIEPIQKTLELELVGDCCDESLPKSYARRYRLTYKELESFTSIANPKRHLPGPGGYGDLGYDEIEVLAPGRFEHRMLFSSSIEFHVRFGSFSLWYEDYDFAATGYGTT
jgi:hypothetical protein